FFCFRGSFLLLPLIENLCSYSLLDNRHTFWFHIGYRGRIQHCMVKPFFLFLPSFLLFEGKAKNRCRLQGKIPIFGFLCCIVRSISPSRCSLRFLSFLQLRVPLDCSHLL